MKLNHVLVRTSNLDVAKYFFIDVIGLDNGSRPAFPFAGDWYYSDRQPLVHVVEDRVNAISRHGSLAHVAFEANDYCGLIQRLKANQQPFTERDVPESGERQVFIEGPDGLLVEMLFAKGVSSEPRPYSQR